MVNTQARVPLLHSKSTTGKNVWVTLIGWSGSTPTELFNLV